MLLGGDGTTGGAGGGFGLRRGRYDTYESFLLASQTQTPRPTATNTRPNNINMDALDLKKDMRPSNNAILHKVMTIIHHFLTTKYVRHHSCV